MVVEQQLVSYNKMSCQDYDMKYIPVSTLDRDDCEYLAKTYMKKDVLDKDRISEDVYRLCKKNTTDCRYVLKVIVYDSKYADMRGPDYTHEKIRESWKKEVRILEKLNQCQTRWGFQFSPLIYDSWYCTTDNKNFYYIIMEIFDGNLAGFIEKFKTDDLVKPIAISFLHSLERDLKIIHKLCRICLVDIKLENILYKQTDKYGYTFVFTDTGSATEENDEECQKRDSQKFENLINMFIDFLQEY